jgi:hypothetical protein
LRARPLAAALALVAVLASSTPLGAQPPDPNAAEALAATLRVLLDPAQRSAVLAGSPQGGALDQQIRSLTGGSDALAQELFALAADVLQEVTQATGGDATTLAQTLERARSDPAAFAAMLSPRTQERLRQLSVRISDQRR